MFLCCSNKIFLPVKLNFQPLCPLQVWWCHTHLSSQSFQMWDKIAEFGHHLQMVLFLWHLSSQSFLRGWDILILFLPFGNRRHLQRCQLWVGWLFMGLFSSWTTYSSGRQLWSTLVLCAWRWKKQWIISSIALLPSPFGEHFLAGLSIILSCLTLFLPSFSHGSWSYFL